MKNKQKIQFITGRMGVSLVRIIQFQSLYPERADIERKSGEITDTEISLVTKADLKLYNLLLRMRTKIQRDAKPDLQSGFFNPGSLIWFKMRVFD